MAVVEAHAPRVVRSVGSSRPVEASSYFVLGLRGLKARGLSGVKLAISDDHAGLKQAIREELTDAVWQRCYVHFLRNALDYLPRKADDDCLQELRWLEKVGGP